MYLYGSEIIKKHRETQEGKRLEHWLKKLDSTASELLENHFDVTCSKQDDRHFKFQCMFHEDYAIVSYNRGNYAHLGMEQVEQFICFMAADELNTFIDENVETSVVASKFYLEIPLFFIIA